MRPQSELTENNWSLSCFEKEQDSKTRQTMKTKKRTHHKTKPRTNLLDMFVIESINEKLITEMSTLPSKISHDSWYKDYCLSQIWPIIFNTPPSLNVNIYIQRGISFELNYFFGNKLTTSNRTNSIFNNQPHIT